MLTLRQLVESIWMAGVQAVDSEKLVRQAIHREGESLVIANERFALSDLDRIVVVGAGKAGAGMAAGVEAALGIDLVQSKVTGWLNVPADCVRPLAKIQLHAARAAGVNEPSAEGVQGSEAILELVASLTNRDLCLVLISGGGSALLPAPIEGVTLEDKLAVTRLLMRSSVPIQQLNTVRKRLSRIKGGGLLRTATAGRMISLIISDVPGNPLDIIASGPTVCDSGTAADALEILNRVVQRQGGDESLVPQSIWRELREQAAATSKVTAAEIPCTNQIIGNNQTAVAAAAARATQLGFDVRILGADRQGIARDWGLELADLCLKARAEMSSKTICFIAGGEPVVTLAKTDKPRRGGRNQEVVLSACQRLWLEPTDNIAILSGGTDGEDGPTDAAGAVFDHEIHSAAKRRGLLPYPYLAINDSYTYFEQVGGLLKTGPTHTNVMDLQVALVAGRSK